jgi:alanine dehydrogenase
MPGALARTATQALNNATLPYVLELANKGIKRALSENPGLLQGLNIVDGKLTSSSVASAQQIMAISLESGLQIL